MSTDKQEPKNPTDYGYAGGEKITILAEEFIALRQALNKAMDNGTRVELPQLKNFFDMEKGTRVKKPTKKKLEEGNLKEFIDNEETFNKENAQVVYDANLYPEIYNGLSLLMMIHNRNVEDGTAKSSEELKRLYEERQEQPPMDVVEE